MKRKKMKRKIKMKKIIVLLNWEA